MHGGVVLTLNDEIIREAVMVWGDLTVAEDLALGDAGDRGSLALPTLGVFGVEGVGEVDGSGGEPASGWGSARFPPSN